MEKLILKHALKNAYDHEGKANSGAVMNRVIGENPELKKDMAILGKEVKKIMISIASQVIVLCDSSKFGNKAFAQIAPVSMIDTIITDISISDYDSKAFQTKGINVKIVNV